ncbi:hypothetical protein [Enterococcus phage MDA2]|uniref:Uncharacterized protein n=1 Tax=Enterococcus phage MDA2 TaxID=2816459 RepID=A0AAE7UXJ5_9CAUD|nr:hypothetical protein [Enterococcus phage MDA2]
MNSFMNKQAKQVKRSKEIKLVEEVRRENVKKRFSEEVKKYLEKGYTIRLENKVFPFALISIDLEKGEKVISLILVNEYDGIANYTAMKKVTLREKGNRAILKRTLTDKDVKIISLWKGI